METLFDKNNAARKEEANAKNDGAKTEGSKKEGSKKMSVERVYQKKTQLEHILLRPDTYVGSVEPVTQQMWVFDEDVGMNLREITYVPGMYKIFDEILVNAADNKQRDKNMSCIKITIDPESNIISIWNNGKGIPVVEHKNEKMYVPALIFGHLLTSSNYDDDEKKVTGGRNGYGAKLCNIFSTKFTVETASKEYKHSFKQVNGFRSYVDLYVKDKLDETGVALKVVNETVNDRWEVCLTMSEKGFQQISFVNSIATTKGGRHVDYVVDQIVSKLIEVVKKKNKAGVSVKPFQVKNHIWVFVNALIENPTFDSQTKENMTLQTKSFGSKCPLSEKFIRSATNCGIVESILNWVKFKAQTQLNKKCSSVKYSKIKGIPKLDDANDAGGKHSTDCTLILTEGDSAKSLAVSGLAVIGRDRYGVFPLRGKILNVREASHKQIMENAEINNIIKIVGLQYKKSYDDPESLRTLRYGKIMIMTDQDQDGSHIKGLLINFFHHNWPSLLRHSFLEEFITPIVKATKNKQELAFYSIPEFDEWKKQTENYKTWHIKYYKGLGTSTGKEAKEYFADMDRHRIMFKYAGPEDDAAITLAFSKKKTDDRKEWLTNFMEDRRQRRMHGLPEHYDNNIYQCTVRFLLENKSKRDLIRMLVQKGYESDPVTAWNKAQEKLLEDNADDDDDTSSIDSGSTSGPNFNYILSMPLWCLTKEKVQELLKQRDTKKMELDDLERKTPCDLWKEDLAAFVEELDRVEAQEKEDMMAGKAAKLVKGKVGKPKIKKLQLEETLPSPYGRRIVPQITQAMKADASRKMTKKKKATLPATQQPILQGEVDSMAVKIEFDEEQDGMTEEGSGLNSINTSVITPTNTPAVKVKTPRVKKEKKEPGTPRTKKTPTAKGTPKKTKKRNPWSDDESKSESDLEEREPVVIPRDTKSQRSSAAKPKYTFDFSEEEGNDDDDDDDVRTASSPIRSYKDDDFVPSESRDRYEEDDFPSAKSKSLADPASPAEKNHEPASVFSTTSLDCEKNNDSVKKPSDGIPKPKKTPKPKKFETTAWEPDLEFGAPKKSATPKGKGRGRKRKPQSGSEEEDEYSPAKKTGKAPTSRKSKKVVSENDDFDINNFGRSETSSRERPGRAKKEVKYFAESDDEDAFEMFE
ncbi:UNVERIFIED_CONTAM: hypothetical protein FKN15_075068 [Acipenser sinensis]